MGILFPKDIQKAFRDMGMGKSLKWICEHYEELGGKKVGGRYLFPKDWHKRMFDETLPEHSEGAQNVEVAQATKLKRRANIAKLSGHVHIKRERLQGHAG